MSMPHLRTYACNVALLACASLAASCGNPSQHQTLDPDVGNPLSFLSVSYETQPDGFPPGTVAHSLRVTNPSAQTLDDVSISYDGKYRTPLQSLLVYQGFVKGCTDLGRSSILPGDDLVFPFSHDVSNHQVMTDPAGSPYPRTVAPANITITTSGAEGTWHVR